MQPPTLTVTPIGLVHTPFRSRADTPRQPHASGDVAATIELYAGHGFEFALEDLAGWDHIWVVFWFHLNAGWKPKVWPPRSDRRRGVFATRAPHRPNPLGLSVVRLERIDGLVLHVRGADMIDGTPVLDLKPYVPWADAVPSARTGWLTPPDDHSASGIAVDPRGEYTVTFAPLATLQLAFLLGRHDTDLGTALRRALALGPDPHPYRRIRPDGDAMRIALKEWRARFRANGREIEVLSIESGYQASQLDAGGVDLTAHREFRAKWG